MRNKKPFRREASRDNTRINEMIQENEIRLIDQEGEHVGVVSVKEALEKAQEAQLDLVEVSAKSKPHVCRIMDYGQYKYQQAKKQKDAKKKQKQIVVKEIKLRPRIEKHDYDFKFNNAVKFLEHGDKVRFILQFRGREMAHKELGLKVMERLINDLSDLASIEQKPRQEGRFMNMTLAPLPVKQRKSKEEEDEDEKKKENEDDDSSNKMESTEDQKQQPEEQSLEEN